MVLNKTLKDANTVAIDACVAELILENAKNWSKMPISATFSLKTLFEDYQKCH